MNKEWQKHDGGPCPVGPGVKVDYRLRTGFEGTATAWHLRWDHCVTASGSDVVAYRRVEAELSDEWVPHRGGGCPVSSPATLVAYRKRNGQEGTAIAGGLSWYHCDTPAGAQYDIVAYAELGAALMVEGVPAGIVGEQDPEIPLARRARVEQKIAAAEAKIAELTEQKLAAIEAKAAAGKRPYLPAPEILRAALGHIADRAATYDKPAGERSVPAVAEAFAAITGIRLTPEQGWLFLVLLKATRSQQGEYRGDNYEDLAAYAALMGEAAACAR